MVMLAIDLGSSFEGSSLVLNQISITNLFDNRLTSTFGLKKIFNIVKYSYL